MSVVMLSAMPSPPAASASTARPSTPSAPGTAAPTHTSASDLLVTLTAGLAAGNDLGGLVVRLLQPLAHIAGAGAAAARVLDTTGQRMLLIGSVGLPAEVEQAERAVEAGCGVCGAALAGQQAMRAHDLSPCGRRSAGPYFGHQCAHVLAVPMQFRGHVLGLFNLFFDARHEPPPDVLALLETVGALLGLALHNARLERENLAASMLHERQALAADVHDSIGQSLAFVKMRLPLLHDAIRHGPPGDAERYFDDVRAAVGQAHASLRGILAQYRSPPDPLGLAHALERTAESFRRACPATLELDNRLPAGLLAPEQESQLAHIAQEALLNAARHAAARRVWLHLDCIERTDGRVVQLLVQDDGAGPGAAADLSSGDGTAGGANGGAHLIAANAEAAGSHYGMAIMRDRARRLGGLLEVRARAGGGTTVRLEFPLPGRTAASAPANLPPAGAPTSAEELH